MAKRLKLEQVKENIEKKYPQSELLSSEYINKHTVLTVRCCNGHVFTTNSERFRKGHWCQKCSGVIRRETFLKNWGVDNPNKVKSVRDKIDETNIERYGSKSPSSNEDVRQKIKESNLLLYGHENAMQNKEVREKARQTNLIRYGCGSPSQNHDIALKQAKKVNSPSTKIHWKTGEECWCQGGWEAKTVDYLNANEIDFLWQSKTFTLSTGKTYRPDLYLVGEDLWVEIKGWFQGDALEKWTEFHEKHPNSQLWDFKKLKQMKIL
jgi:hypothetical protein